MCNGGIHPPLPPAHDTRFFICFLSVEAVPEDEMLESGWEELGISVERASEIAIEMSEGNVLNAVDFYKVISWIVEFIFWRYFVVSCILHAASFCMNFLVYL